VDLLCRPRFEPVRTESSVTRVGQLLRGLGILSNNWLITPEVPLNAGSVRHSGTYGLVGSTRLDLPPTRRKEDKISVPVDLCDCFSCPGPDLGKRISADVGHVE
jgi:hypothetical protein